MQARERSEALRFDFSAAGQPADAGATDGVAGSVADLARASVARPERPVGVASATKDAAAAEDRPRGAYSETALGVGELYERVRLALRLGLPDEVWVIGEVRKVTVGRSGHRFIELADSVKGGHESNASIDVTCWNRDWPTIAAELDSVGLELAVGLTVRVRGRLDVWEAASRLRLSMTALDVDALVGGIAAARRKLLKRLGEEGLLDANKRLGVPLVPMRIGVVTSAGSEAYRDLSGTLSRSGFAFDVRLEHSLVQGQGAPQQVAAAISRLQHFAPDLIVVVRGGGARGDLAAFDSELVARAIATSRHPVWTGIGHTGDESVADEVAQRALATPTACAEAIVELVATFQGRVGAAAERLAPLARSGLASTTSSLTEKQRRLETAAGHQLERARDLLEHSARMTERAALATTERSGGRLAAGAGRVATAVRHLVSRAEQETAHRRRMLTVYDPRHQLRRGWSLTRSSDGTILRSVASVQPGALLTTVLADGKVVSQASEVERDERQEGPEEDV